MRLAYLELGFEHILDINGIDHILFIIALCAIYLITDWKKILVLITAFTVGHSITLALATYDLVKITSSIIEPLIPLTIMATCVYNILSLNYKNKSKITLSYILAIGFGLIHGMGFSYLLKNLLGKEESIFVPLLSFNIGLEIGQLIIVSTILFASYIIINLLKISQKWYIISLSVLIFFYASYLLFLSVN
ncbi:MAG: HupE/UreJ family protein [Saprospiraceae bacterium]